MTKASEDVSQNADLASHAHRPFESRLATTACIVRAMAAPVTGGPATASSKPNPDAGLLAAVAKSERLETVLCDMNKDLNYAGSIAIDPQLKTLSRQSSAATAVVLNTPARTMAGLQAKARLVRSYIQNVAGDGPDEGQEPLVWSLVEDILRGVAA